jgi:hypothetical protein
VFGSHLTAHTVVCQGQADKYCTTRFMTSSYQKQTLNLTATKQPTAYQRAESESSQSSIFDCVKPPNNSSVHERRESSSSLSSLFQSCRRPSDCENEYTDTYSYNRSDSAISSGSQSVAFNNNHHSRTSLASNASYSSRLSFPDYSEEELAMLDGDEPTYESDLRRVRNYHVVTTAGESCVPFLSCK